MKARAKSVASAAMLHAICAKLDGAVVSTMFGAPCIKSSGGKAAAILWNGNMLFKLNERDRSRALVLLGARVGFHLYAPERPMKEWVFVPNRHARNWPELVKQALAHVCED